MEGPEESVFSVVHSDLPKLISMNQWLKKYVNGQTEDYAVDGGETVTVMATQQKGRE